MTEHGILRRARLGAAALIPAAVLMIGVLPASAATAQVARTGQVTAVAAVAAPAAPAVAAAASGSFKCGLLTCSYVFSRATTRDIATGSAGVAVCAAIPTPGNIGCAIGLAALVVSANYAKNRNECVVANFTKTPPPLGTWWPSTTNSSRCKN